MSSTVVSIDSARSAASYAQRYVGLGWWVLPLTPGTKKPLSRLVPNGFHNATNDPTTVERWWNEWPEAGIGVALKRSGLVAIDIDPRNGGIDTMDALEARHGPIVSDVLAYTGGGGEHRVYAAELVERLPGKLGPGVELKADGYIAVEPTLHPSGKHYAWEASSDPLDGIIPTTLPTWIRDLAGPEVVISSAASAPIPIDSRRVASLQEALRYIGSDEREVWVRVGQAIHNEMPGEAGFLIWDTWSKSSSKYDPRDQLRVWRSFKHKGLAGVGINTVFAMAQAVGWKNDGGVKSDMANPISALSDWVLTLEQLHARAARLSWAVKGLVPDASIGVIFGASGTFKSFIALDYVLHRAYGMPWLGRKTRQAVPIYIAAEGGAGFMRRIEAWHLQHGRDWHECPMRVVPIAVTLRTDAKLLREAVQALGVVPGDIVVDTMSQTFTGDENSSDDVSSFLRTLGTELRDAFGCTVTIIHHTGHTATERPRGSSAMLANVDFMFGVFRNDGEAPIATVECVKQKDAEKAAPFDMSMARHQLGKDEDGDAITSLCAQHLNLAETLLAGDKAAARGSHRELFLALAQNGMAMKELRTLFLERLGEVTEATRKAFTRSRQWAIEHRFIEDAQGTVIVLQAVDNSLVEEVLNGY